MTSLLSLLPGTTSPASALPGRDASAAADPADTPFSSFLTIASVGAEPAPARVAGDEALPLLQLPAELPPTGIGLPPMAGTGKFLPFALPPVGTLPPVGAQIVEGEASELSPVGDDTPADEKRGEDGPDIATILPFAPLLPMAALPQPATPPAIASDATPPPVFTGAAPVLTPLAVTRDGTAPAPMPAASQAEAGEPAPPPLAPRGPAVVVALDAAPSSPDPQTIEIKGEQRSPQVMPARFSRTEQAVDQPVTDQQPGQAPSKDPSAEPATRPAAASLAHPRAETMASFAPSQAPLSPSPTPTLASAAQPQPLHELSAIVDRLAAAREAMAPAVAALALDHAEFGELKLRFEQQQDGQLVVGLSANNAEAHRAVAAALAADRQAFFGGERPGAESQQQQQGGQARNGGGGLDRGAGGTGNGNGSGGSQSGSGHARHDTPRGNPERQGWRTAGGRENPQSGIYA